MQRRQIIELQPNQQAIDYFNRACGVARFAYNKALDEWNEWYSLGGQPSGFAIERYFNSIKKEKYPWVYDVTKCAFSKPFSNLQKAFNRFFKGEGKYPKKKKKYKRDRFYLANDQFKIEGKYIVIPNLGKVKLSYKLRYKGKLLGAVISRRANRWFVSLSFDLTEDIGSPSLIVSDKIESVGIDWGVNTFAVLSDGTQFENPRLYERFKKKLRHLQKELDRRKKKVPALDENGNVVKDVDGKPIMVHTKNYKKTLLKLQKLHYRITCCRKDFTHKTTRYIADHYKIVCIEDLNISGMLKGKCARSIQDVAPYEFRRQLCYKCDDALGQRAKSGTNVKNSRTGTPGGPVPKTTEDVANEIGISKSTLKENKQLARDLTPKAKDVVRQSEVRIIGRFDRSTKECSICHAKLEVKRGDRIIRCHCGNIDDRDSNASKVIEYKGLIQPVKLYRSGQVLPVELVEKEALAISKQMS